MTVALLLLSGARAQNLLSNGGFELPGLPGNEPTRSLTNGNTLLSGWTIVDDGVGQPPLYVQLPNSDGIIEGTYGLILNQGSGIRTTFRAEAGAFYELSLWHRPDDCQQCVTPAPLQVSISGTVYTLPIIPGWSQRRVQFWATNSVNTLEIVNPSSPADFKQFGLDEVSIMKVPGVVLNINMYPGV